jgi:uncharacterized protein YndB with AHSA1/START domain
MVIMDNRRSWPLVDESVVIAAPAHEVWRAVVEAEVRAGWWGYLELDASVGGRFEERWTDGSGRQVLTDGLVTEVVADRLLALSWKDDSWPAATQVEMRLAEDGAKTLVRLVHTGWQALPDGSALAEEHRMGWRMHLDSLRRCVEAGG